MKQRKATIEAGQAGWILRLHDTNGDIWGFDTDTWASACMVMSLWLISARLPLGKYLCSESYTPIHPEEGQ
jgi:hypothetical protein